MSEQRRNPRRSCRFPAAAEGPRGPVRGACTNLSVGGLFLEGADLPVGSTALVSVDFGPLGKLSVVSRVARRSTAPSGIGMEFERLEQSQLELLHRVVQALPDPDAPAPGPSGTWQPLTPRSRF